MGVELTISRPGHATEFVRMSDLETAEGLYAQIASKHEFRILTGVYPAFINDSADLEQVINEIRILREESIRQTRGNVHFSLEQRQALVREKWDRLLARLEQLKNEPDAQAYFG